MKKAKRVKCDSGLWGWQCRLRDNYSSLEEFEMYAETYGIAERLGYKTARNAWSVNPLIQGSVEPSDFRKVKNKRA